MQMDDKIIDYIQSRMTGAESAAFEDEMSQNPNLRAEVTALQAARAVLGDTSDDQPKDGWARFSDRIDAQQPGAANDNRPMRFSLLQVACVAAAAVIGWQAVETVVFPQNPSGFATASAEQAGPSVQVVFAADAAVADVSAALGDLNGAIIDGPSALGIYTVAFPDADTRDAALSALAANGALVDEVLKNE